MEEPLGHLDPFETRDELRLFAAGLAGHAAQPWNTKPFSEWTAKDASASRLRDARLHPFARFFLAAEAAGKTGGSDARMRVVADYIAGMTDGFILLQYAQIKRALRR